jgi:hypothetical protein
MSCFGLSINISTERKEAVRNKCHNMRFFGIDDVEVPVCRAKILAFRNDTVQ